MERCSTVQMRKNLEMVNEYKLAGIDFIPVPITSVEERIKLATLAIQNLDKIEKECE